MMMLTGNHWNLVCDQGVIHYLIRVKHFMNLKMLNIITWQQKKLKEKGKKRISILNTGLNKLLQSKVSLD